VNRREFALASLAAGAKGRPLTPVQLQKFLFILDRNIGSRVRGSGFAFRAYHYGPFDSSVYTTLQSLRDEGLAEISQSPGAYRMYGLTEAGQAAGDAIVAQLDRRVTEHMAAVGEFVRSQSFASLVSSIYKAYPDMKVNSVFQE
jgi:hypothetical protein